MTESITSNGFNTCTLHSNLKYVIWSILKSAFLYLSLANVAGIAVGVTVGSIVLFAVIVVCVVIGCCIAQTSSTHPRTTVTTVTPSPASTAAVVTTSSQEHGFQAYPTARTDPPAYEMSTYFPPPNTYPPKEADPPPPYPYPA